MNLVPVTFQHYAQILALNEESVHVLSPLTLDRLVLLDSIATYHKVAIVGVDVAAFLLAFGPGVPYDSPNYRWFAERCGEFLYIDRVVVRPQSRSQGLGAALYRDVFEYARRAGFKQVVCEFDVDPPNPASEAFHRSFGFSEVGTQLVAGGTKRVSLQRASLSQQTSGSADA